MTEEDDDDNFLKGDKEEVLSLDVMMVAPCPVRAKSGGDHDGSGKEDDRHCDADNCDEEDDNNPDKGSDKEDEMTDFVKGHKRGGSRLDVMMVAPCPLVQSPVVTMMAVAKETTTLMKTTMMTLTKGVKKRTTTTSLQGRITAGSWSRRDDDGTHLLCLSSK